MTVVADANTLIERMATGLEPVIRQAAGEGPLMVGIHTGGAWIAEQLHRRLELATPLGTLDIAFYRDDFSRRGMHPEVRPSRLPLSVEDREIILVDDVLYSGRTVRAALNELFDYGRPGVVRLAVLVDRDGRELPIAADVAGTRIALEPSERVALDGPDPLDLRLERPNP